MSLPIAHKELIQAIACVLSDPHYEKRWFGLDTIADICNSLSPDGLAVNKTTTINAFKISGGLFFALFPFSDQLKKEIGRQGEELVLAVRRLRKPGTAGFFTVVGCFEENNIPDENTAHKAYSGVSIGRSSTRTVQRIDLPLRVCTELDSYINRPGKRYFLPVSHIPTPQIRRRPNTAESTNPSTKKKRRPRTPKSATPQTPQYKTKSQRIEELQQKIERQIMHQKGLEEKIASKVRVLKALEMQIETANCIEAAIQKNLDELERLGVKNHQLTWQPKKEELFYSLGRNSSGVIDVFTDRGVVFLSELSKGVLHQSIPEEEEMPLEDDAAATAEETIVLEDDGTEAMENDAEHTQQADLPRNTRKRRRNTRRARNRRAMFVLDKERCCWVPK
ncbi:hypothetical protein ACHAWO_006439 [Cyclotella atomus]|uniref:Uncharacterized protein n=1 Tax=Cyclotella atomus TaxID=382360 RepID=A0ABD3NTY1_9STRA